MVAPTYRDRWPIYARQWDAMKFTRGDTIYSVAKRLIAARDRYKVVEKATGVPWTFVAVAHERESSQSWSASLAQGDPWNRVSTHVPAGRGPFKSWEDAAVDALVTLKHLDRVIDWRLEKILYHLEAYNGWGYFNRGVPSAYLWAGSDQYHGGKYIADGVWSRTAMDQQLGCAPMLRAMADLDPSIQFSRETKEGVPPPAQKPPVLPKPPAPTTQPSGLFTRLATFLARLFGR